MAPEEAQPEFVCYHGVRVVPVNGWGEEGPFWGFRIWCPCVEALAKKRRGFGSFLPFEAAGGRA